MRAGRMRERVTIQQETITPDGMKGGAKSWSAIATDPEVWAAIEPTRGGERLVAMQLQDSVSHDVTIRWRADVTAKHRLLWGAVALNIRAVLPDPRRRHLTLYCEQGVGT